MVLEGRENKEQRKIPVSMKDGVNSLGYYITRRLVFHADVLVDWCNVVYNGLYTYPGWGNELHNLQK
jgi:hypothetical protein